MGVGWELRPFVHQRGVPAGQRKGASWCMQCAEGASWEGGLAGPQLPSPTRPPGLSRGGRPVVPWGGLLEVQCTAFLRLAPGVPGFFYVQPLEYRRQGARGRVWAPLPLCPVWGVGHFPLRPPFSGRTTHLLEDSISSSAPNRPTAQCTLYPRNFLLLRLTSRSNEWILPHDATHGSNYGARCNLGRQ
jgi:hypothetical protein